MSLFLLAVVIATAIVKRKVAEDATVDNNKENKNSNANSNSNVVGSSKRKEMNSNSTDSDLGTNNTQNDMVIMDFGTNNTQNDIGRETSGSTNNDDPQQSDIDTVTTSDAFALSIKKYVDIYFDDLDVCQDLLEQLKPISSIISTQKSANTVFMTKVTLMIKTEVTRRKPCIKTVLNLFLNLTASKDLTRNNEARHSKFIENYVIEEAYTQEKSNVNGKEIFRVLYGDRIVHDSEKNERFCLKSSNDILAIIFFGGPKYINRLVRSYDDLVDKPLDKLLDSLNITKHKISNDSDNDEIESNAGSYNPGQDASSNGDIDPALNNTLLYLN
jgi:hypothetical protein